MAKVETPDYTQIKQLDERWDYTTNEESLIYTSSFRAARQSSRRSDWDCIASSEDGLGGVCEEMEVVKGIINGLSSNSTSYCWRSGC